MSHELTQAEQNFRSLMDMDDRETRIFRTILETAELRGWNRCVRERVTPLVERLYPREEKQNVTL